MKSRIKSARITEDQEQWINQNFGSFSRFVDFFINNSLNSKNYLVALRTKKGADVIPFATKKDRDLLVKHLKKTEIEYAISI